MDFQVRRRWKIRGDRRLDDHREYELDAKGILYESKEQREL
jgi:hypothetical protein